MERILLSICISTFNRPRSVEESIKNILQCTSDNYEIVIQDCSTNNETLEVVSLINSEKVKYFKKNKKGNNANSVMEDWKSVLFLGKGIFVFNLNDRDRINHNYLSDFISFLDKYRYTTGGVCRKRFGKFRIYNGCSAFIHIPYYSYHPSGLVFNRDCLDEVVSIDSIFTNEKSYIHPHDLLLAELSLKGTMFNYTRHLWSLSSNNSFKHNQSYLHEADIDIDTIWFSPKSRFAEMRLFIEDLLEKNMNSKIKRHKIMMIMKRYLYYSVFDFYFYLQDEGQAMHYGYVPYKLSKLELNDIKRQYIEKCIELNEKMTLGIDGQHLIWNLNLYYVFLEFCLPIWNTAKKIIY